jgi:DNA-binding CsgD family transcriptional regulator
MGGPGSGRRPSQITPKQAEVADLVCNGKTLVEAGMILGLNVNAAKSRWRKVKEKLDATRDTLAVARYVELKLKEQI